MKKTKQLISIKKYPSADFSLCDQLPDEHLLQLIIDNEQRFNLICTNEAIKELIIGFLFNTGLIFNIKEITSLEIDNNHKTASVTLLPHPKKLPCQIVRTSSMGEDILNSEIFLPSANLNRKFSLTHILECKNKLTDKAIHYQQTGGMHASLLSDGQNLLSFYEDIGRHNTFDKICGDCLLKNLPSKDTLLITTGRISSDMAKKAARLGVTCIASFSTTTQRAWKFATNHNISLLGHLGKPNFILLTVPERIID